MPLNMLVPPVPDFAYVRDQALDHFGRHRYDAISAVQEIADLDQRPYRDLGDTRMFAALAVGMSDAARFGQDRGRANHGLIGDIGRRGVVLSSMLELQSHVVAGTLPADGETTVERIRPFLEATRNTLLTGERPEELVTDLDERKQSAVYAGAELLSARMLLPYRPARQAEIEEVLDPLSLAVEQQFTTTDPEELLRVAQNLGAGCIELSAVAAQFLDIGVNYETVRKMARAFGAGGMALRLLTSVEHGLVSGMPTFATRSIGAAEHIGWKELRALSTMANRAAHASFAEVNDMAENDRQRGVFRTLRTEMQAKFQLNRWGYNAARRPLTPARLRSARAVSTL